MREYERVMLTGALRALVRDSKKETIAKFYVEKVTFWYFNVKYTISKIQFLLLVS